MKTSEQIEKLSAALVSAQAAIKPAIKDSTNPHFRSKYADLTAVWDAIHKALGDNELALIQLPVHSEDTRVHLTTRVLHSSGQWLEETASIPIGKQDPHGYGSGLTYLRRYSGVAALFVPTEDDDGNAAAEQGQSAAAKWNEKVEKFGNSGAEVCAIEFQNLQPDEQVSMRLHANIVADSIRRGRPGEAAEYLAKQGFTHEEKIALNSLLDSKQRSALKSVKPTPTELASQP